MRPVLSLVGRPNVGKSTLFNKLTRTRDALVADLPGLTRDRQYGDGRMGHFDYIVIDTGGLSEELADNRLNASDTAINSQASVQKKSSAKAAVAGDISSEMFVQTRLAIEESDLVLFLVDGRSGLTAADEQLAAQLRKVDVPVMLVVNKIDGIGEDMAMSEFYALAGGDPLPISAAHSRGLQRLLEGVAEKLAALGFQLQEDDQTHPDEESSDKASACADIAFIGRPNVGKSTLINRLCGEERVIAFDQPGTTRDAIAVPFSRNGRDYTLVDTAGIRRRGKVREVVEKFSVVKTLTAIERANVCVFLLDATDGVTEQDLQLMGYIIDKGRALVVAVNKWDALDTEAREQIRTALERKVMFLQFTRIHFISALRGSGVNDLFRSIDRAFLSARANLATPELTRLLEIATSKHQPPMVNGRRIKLRYAHQGGVNPPIIVIHGNQTSKLPGDYQRYLCNFFQKQMKLFGTPVQLRLKQTENPFEGRQSASKSGKTGARARRSDRSSDRSGDRSSSANQSRRNAGGRSAGRSAASSKNAGSGRTDGSGSA